MLQETLPYFDLVRTAPTTPKERKQAQRQTQRQAHSIADKLAELRKLHEELNTQLYSAPASERPTVHSPADAAGIIAPFLEPLDHEELWIILLDTRNRVKQLVKIYQGSVNSSQVRIAELFKAAIIENAPAIIVIHNHPSGDPSPSPDDVAITRAIVQAGKILDIDILDHLVIGHDSRFVSLKERGLGFN